MARREVEGWRPGEKKEGSGGGGIKGHRELRRK